MPTAQNPIQCTVKIQGEQLSQSIVRVALDQHVDTHSSLQIDFTEAEVGGSRGDAFLDVNQAGTYLGETVTLEIGYVGENAPALKFVGIVTQYALVNAVDGLNTVRLTAASPTVLLDGARRFKSFENTKASGAVSAVLGSYQITKSSVPATSYQYDWLLQHDETDWEFVRRHLTRSGFFCFYDGEKLQMGPPNGTAALTLTFRENLASFSVGVGIEQPEFSSVIYTPTEEKELRPDSKQVSSSQSLSGFSKTALDASKAAFGVSSMLPLGQAGMSPSDADKLVDGERSRAVARMLECSGTSWDPKLRVGMTVECSGLGNSSGSYFITSVSHQLTGDEGYTNTFQCIPVGAAYPQRPSLPERTAGLRRAVVTDNKDPMQFGRIKVQAAWFGEVATDWLRVLSPYAGAEYGWYVLPEIGDEVLIGFLEGDVQHPFVIGSLYNGVDKPPANAYHDDNYIKLFQTKAGNLIKIDDTSGEEEITFSTVGENNSIVMSNKDRHIQVETKGDVIIKADGNVQVEAKQDISMKATGDVTIEGKAITLKSTADTKIEGLNVDIKANVGFKASGQAQAEVSASGQMTIKGAMVMIN